MMRVLIAHVRYRVRGGEDAVVEHEIDLLKSAGVDVRTLILESAQFDRLAVRTRLDIARGVSDHRWGRQCMVASLEEWAPDVVHAHNLYPLLGIGALEEASGMGPATVQTWHNYRMSCLAGTHVRAGHPCQLCRVGHSRYGVMYGCYRGSRVQSALYARGTRTQLRALHRSVPDIVVCLTDAQRQALVEQGIPPNRLVVKSNSVSEGVPGEWSSRHGAVYVGRLSEEKGIRGLLGSWAATAAQLTVVGTGPLEDTLRAAFGGRSNITFTGSLSPSDVREALRAARVLAFPSLAAEGLPMTVLEALAEGTPVVAFAGGAPASIPSVTCVEYGDFRALAGALEGVCSCDESRWEGLSDESLKSHARRYSDGQNIDALMRLYECAVARRAHRA